MLYIILRFTTLNYTKMYSTAQLHYPAPVEPHMHTLKIYTTILELATLDITIDTVEKVPRKISGAACPGGISAAGLQQWLLCFSVTSQHLHITVASLAS